MSDPINNIEWREASGLNSNDYNPNMVFGPELALLERSILKLGWVQPVLVTRDGTIIDGFHRYRLAQDSPALRAKYGGTLPCAVVDMDRHEAMLTTIRMNRAKGTHSALRMSAIVRELIEAGYDTQQLQAELGATAEEIELLNQDGVFKQRNIAEYRYSKAWYPVERASR